MNAEDYRINTADVVSENVDDEFVVINMKSGNYYSLRNEASDVWKCLQGGLPLSQVSAIFCGRFPGNAHVAKSVEAFAVKLAEEGLLDPLEGRAEGGAAPPEIPERDSFSLPVFEKFTDMHQFIQADPIHDVNETQGWPVLKKD